MVIVVVVVVVVVVDVVVGTHSSTEGVLGPLEKSQLQTDRFF